LRLSSATRFCSAAFLASDSSRLRRSAASRSWASFFS
jgi:hypothetical protein